MRPSAALLALLALAACQKEPDFDTRYDDAATRIEARARAIDADLAKAEAGDAATGAPAATPPAERDAR